jgi:hypothetical protein
MTKAQCSDKAIKRAQAEQKAEDERYRSAAIRGETAPLARDNQLISIWK